MPSTVETPEGYEVVPGRSQKKALALIKIAEDLGLDVHTVTVRPRSDEYVVPKEVADKFRDLKDDEFETSNDGEETKWVPNEDIEEQRKTLDSGTRDEDGEDAVSEQEARGEETDGEKTDDSDEEKTEDEPKDENPVPAKNQSKGDWFDYAKSKGFEGDIDSVTKDALIEKYGTAN